MLGCYHCWGMMSNGGRQQLNSELLVGPVVQSDNLTCTLRLDIHLSTSGSLIASAAVNVLPVLAQAPCPCSWLAFMSRKRLILKMIGSRLMRRKSLIGPRMAGCCASLTSTTWASGWVWGQQSCGCSAHHAVLFILGNYIIRDGIVRSHSSIEVA